MRKRCYDTREMTAMELGIDVAVVNRLVVKLGIKPTETIDKKRWCWRKQFYAKRTTAKLRVVPIRSTTPDARPNLAKPRTAVDFCEKQPRSFGLRHVFVKSSILVLHFLFVVARIAG